MREVRMFGIDIFETHTALGEGFKVDQAFLGIKEHEAKDPFKHLASMFREVVSTMFACAEKYETVWKGINGVSHVDVIGEEKNLNSQPPIHIDLQRMIASFIEDFDKYLPVYRSVLNDDTFLKIEKLKYLEKTAVTFPPDIWAKTVYAFMAKFHKTVVTSERGFLIDALRVLWLGRLAVFIKETAESTPEETEKIIREQAETFVRLKPYLNAVY
jgi:hypothetical protein